MHKLGRVSELGQASKLNVSALFCHLSWDQSCESKNMQLLINLIYRHHKNKHFGFYLQQVKTGLELKA